MHFQSLLLVFMGGGVGSVIRYTSSVLFASNNHKFPFATFLSNALACLLVGFLAELFDKNLIKDQSQMKLLFLTGFCGGFSTFSTYTLELFQMYKSTNWFLFTTYFICTNLICMLLLMLGSGLFTKLKF